MDTCICMAERRMEKMDTCICISHSPETIAALFVNWLYPSTKTKKFFFFFFFNGKFCHKIPPLLEILNTDGEVSLQEVKKKKKFLSQNFPN